MRTFTFNRLAIAALATGGLACGLLAGGSPAQAAGEMVLSQDIKPQVAAGGYRVDYTVTGRNVSTQYNLRVTTFSGNPCSPWKLVSGNLESIPPGGTVVWTCSMTQDKPTPNQFNLRYAKTTAGSAVVTSPGPSTEPTQQPTMVTTQQPTTEPTEEPTVRPSSRPTSSNTSRPRPTFSQLPEIDDEDGPEAEPTTNPGGQRPTMAPSRPSNGNMPGGPSNGGGGIFGGGGGLFGGGFMEFFQKIFAWFTSLFGGMR